MPRLPPTTPFLPRLNHPTDESLLLASPAFDDITLDDSDFWAVPPTGRSLVPRTPSAAGPSRFPPATSTVLPCPTAPSQEGTPFPLGPSYSGSKLSGAGKVGGDFTLDLDAYLPVDVDDSVFIEEDTILVGQGQRLSAGHREAEARAEGSYFDISSGSLKREGGDTPMRTWTKPKKGASDAADVSVHFYPRRMSSVSTNRRIADVPSSTTHAISRRLLRPKTVRHQSSRQLLHGSTGRFAHAPDPAPPDGFIVLESQENVCLFQHGAERGGYLVCDGWSDRERTIKDGADGDGCYGTWMNSTETQTKGKN